MINLDLESFFADSLVQASGDFEFLRKKQHPWVGRKPTPEVGIEIHLHPWENTASVGFDESFGSQCPAYRKEALGIAFPGVGKEQGVAFIE